MNNNNKNNNNTDNKNNNRCFCLRLYCVNQKSNEWFGGIGTFWVKKITQEKSTKFTQVFEFL